MSEWKIYTCNLLKISFFKMPIAFCLNSFPFCHLYVFLWHAYENNKSSFFFPFNLFPFRPLFEINSLSKLWRQRPFRYCPLSGFQVFEDIYFFSKRFLTLFFHKINCEISLFIWRYFCTYCFEIDFQRLLVVLKGTMV